MKEKVSGFAGQFMKITYKMFPKRLKGPAVFPANATGGFVNWMIWDPHMFHKMLHFVELSEACCTLIPIMINAMFSA